MTDHKHEFDGFAYGESYEYDITDTPLYGSDDSASYIPDDNDDTSFYELDDADAYDADLDDVDLDDVDLDDADLDDVDSDNADSDNADSDNADLDDVDSDGADNCSVKNIIYTTEFPAVSLDDLSEPDVTSLTGIDPGIDEDMKRYNITSIVKIAAVAVSAVVLLIFGTISWFTMNREVENTGLQMKASGEEFEISSLPGGNNGAFYNQYHSLVKDSSAIVWQMTAENNINNYYSSSSATSSGSASSSSARLGIYPGSYGVISFNVTPKVDTINLKFTFDIIGYASTKNQSTSSISMSSLEKDKAPGIFLNGHIQLYQNRTGTEGSYVYSNPILSNADMKKVISSKTFNGANTNTQVDIYWVWPMTLSQIVDARDCETINVTEVPITSSGTDYNNVVSNVITYPGYYLKGFNSTASSNSNSSNSGSSSSQSANASSTASANSSSVTSQALTESIIERDYDKYGDWYDRADNDIGMSVSFVLLKMNVEKAD